MKCMLKDELSTPEIMQDVLPIQREMDVLDVFANMVGITIAIGTARFLDIR